MRHLIHSSTIPLLTVAALLSGGCKKDKADEVPAAFKVGEIALTDIPAAGAEKSIVVTSNVPWSVAGVTDWCTVKPQSGTGNETVVVTISENTTTKKRNAELMVKAEGFDPVKVPVSQLEKLAFQAEAGAMTDIPIAGAEKSIAITSNVSWSVAGVTDWCTVKPQSGTGNETVVVTISKNDTPQKRNTTLTVSANGFTPVNISVSQLENPVFKVEAGTMTGTSSAGATKNIVVTSNVPWSITGATDWCTVKPQSGTGNETVVVTITENATLQKRNATLTFTANGFDPIPTAVSQNFNVLKVIKDSNLRKWLDTTYGGGTGLLDDVSAITEIVIPVEVTPTIKSLEGIENFYNLKVFDFNAEWGVFVDVKPFDFSVFPKLTSLTFTHTQITSFSIKNTPGLEKLNISQNPNLSTIDLTDLNDKLVTFYCNDTAIGPELDISKYTNLVYFVCEHTNIKTLYVWWDPNGEKPEQLKIYGVPPDTKLVKR